MCMCVRIYVIMYAYIYLYLSEWDLSKICRRRGGPKFWKLEKFNHFGRSKVQTFFINFPFSETQRHRPFLSLSQRYSMCYTPTALTLIHNSLPVGSIGLPG